jgi:hypothetical protein
MERRLHICDHPRPVAESSPPRQISRVLNFIGDPVRVPCPIPNPNPNPGATATRQEVVVTPRRRYSEPRHSGPRCSDPTAPGPMAPGLASPNLTAPAPSATDTLPPTPNPPNSVQNGAVVRPATANRIFFPQSVVNSRRKLCTAQGINVRWRPARDLSFCLTLARARLSGEYSRQSLPPQKNPEPGRQPRTANCSVL